MKLIELIKNFEYTVFNGDENKEINQLKNDSRLVEKGDVFVCIKGAGFDGHKFIDDVYNKGAVAVVVMEDISEYPSDLTVIKVEDTRYALALMSVEYFDRPAEKLITIGITGTKGKTTTAYMVKSVLDSVGIKTGLIGTIETIIGDEKIPSKNTTPESFVVQETFDKMQKSGIKCVVMEVSSQALKYHRVAGINFDYGIFTNLEPDHIGPNEHENFDDYKNAKAKLLKQCKCGIVNMDADYIDDVLKGHTCELETYGLDDSYDFSAKNIELYNENGKMGIAYDLCGKLNFPVKINVPGKFSVYNSLCAIAICSHFTADREKIENALLNINVKGRVEMINISKRFTLMIDYAHNAMSLESLLTTLKEYNPKRLVVLFGCGGNRSKDRRFEMGEVSSNLADFTIVTSDNPRFEEPSDIISDIVVGVNKGPGKHIEILDRKEAIKYAILNSKDGDVIVLAGKGHEDYQEIKGKKYPMDEREIIKDIISLDEVKAVL